MMEWDHPDHAYSDTNKSI